MTYVAIVPYADVTYGDAYFADIMGDGPWTDATSAEKLKALKRATTSIDNLNFAGVKHDEDQVLQFPRGDDTVVPIAIKNATCQLAKAFLDDVDPNLEMERLQRTSQSVGDLRTQRDSSFSQDHIAAGIPSLEAWVLLSPFMRNSQILDVDRS